MKGNFKEFAPSMMVGFGITGFLSIITLLVIVAVMSLNGGHGMPTGIAVPWCLSSAASLFISGFLGVYCDRNKLKSPFSKE